MWFRRFLVLAVLLLTVNGWASVTTLCNTYISDNPSAAILTTYVSTSTIIPGIHKILSIAVNPSPGSVQPSAVAIYDATAAAQISNTYLKGECEAVPYGSNDRVFPYPKHLANGLAIVQSPHTLVTIEYTR